MSKHSAKWREIGTYLGFHGRELDIIAAKPNLYHEGPKGFLREIFSEWLEWVPGDHRGSTKYPTLEILKTAISKSGLGATAATLSVTTEVTNPLLAEASVTIDGSTAKPSNKRNDHESTEEPNPKRPRLE